MKQFDYQVTGSQFLIDNPASILGDDMGLGKTGQTLVALDKVGAKRVLIVCPNTVKQVWQDQIGEWLGDAAKADSVIIHGRDPYHKREEHLRAGKRFTIINLEGIGKRTVYEKDELGNKVAVNTEVRLLGVLEKVKWDAIIVDESHRIRNRKSKVFNAMRAIRRTHPQARVHLLTGTPILKEPEEIWTSLHILFPKQYTSFHRWANEECNMAFNPYSRWPEPVGIKDPEAFKARLGNVMLRRLKSDVLPDLPDKTFVNVDVHLNDEQRKMYRSMDKSMFIELAGKEIDAVNPLAKQLRLRQISISPDIIDPGSDKITGAKIDAVIEICQSLGEQKAVIFSQFSTVIKRLSKRLQREGVKCVSFTGEDTAEHKHAVVAALQEQTQGPQVLLCTTQAGGVGLTMTAASVAIFVDLMWVPALNAQAVDRLHRIGQKSAVTVYNIRAINTVEWRVEQVLAQRSAMFDSLIPVNRVNWAIARVIQEGPIEV